MNPPLGYTGRRAEGLRETCSGRLPVCLANGGHLWVDIRHVWQLVSLLGLAGRHGIRSL